MMTAMTKMMEETVCDWKTICIIDSLSL